jgi:hypothetical protein
MGSKIKRVAKIAGGIMLATGVTAVAMEVKNDQMYMKHTHNQEVKEWGNFFRVLTPRSIDREGGFNWYD